VGTHTEWYKAKAVCHRINLEDLLISVLSYEKRVTLLGKIISMIAVLSTPTASCEGGLVK
jgi:hypothetical protein